MTQDTAPAVVDLDRVRKEYDGGRIVALDDISMRIGHGASVAIIGRSGSGKSSMLNAMAGLDRPTRGRVLIDGREPPSAAHWTKLRQSTMGLVFQSFLLLPTLTARENVEVAMFPRLRSVSARRARAEELIAEVGLADRAHHRPGELSGGERQRVAIARSLANDPRLLLADEPTGNLDSRTSAHVLELLMDLHKTRGMALILVTHDPAVADRCNRQIRMVDGRVVEDRTRDREGRAA